MRQNPRRLALRRALLCAPVALFLVALPGQLMAQTAWKASGSANSGNWTDPSHWTAGVPGLTSVVTIDLEPGAPYTVTNNGAGAVSTLTLNSSAVTFQTNSMNIVANNELKVTKGVVNLTNNILYSPTIRFDGTSTLNMSSATVRGDNLIENTGTLNVVANTAVFLSVHNTINNSSTINATGFQLNFQDFDTFTNSSIINCPTAYLTFKGYSTATSVLTNSGTITADAGLNFNTLKTITNNGTIAVGNNSTVSSTLNNSGTIAIGATGVFSVSSATLNNLAGGTIQGRVGQQGRLALADSTLMVADAFNPNITSWILDSSKILDSGLTGSVTNNGILTMRSSDPAKYTRVSVPVINNGTIAVERLYNILEKSVVNEGNIYVKISPALGFAELTAQSGLTNRGLFELSGGDQTAGGPAKLTIGGTNSFVNEGSGTFLIAGGVYASSTFIGNLDNQGTMTVNRPLTMNKSSATYLNSGQINIGATSAASVTVSSINTFANSNTITAGAASAISLTGVTSATSIFTNSSSGTITADGGISFSTFKTVTNDGTISIGNDSSLSGGTFVNSGQVVLEEATFTVTSAIFDNRAGGKIEDNDAIAPLLVFDRSTLKVADAFTPDVRFWTLDRSKIEGTGSITNDRTLDIFSSSAATPSRISVPLTNNGIIRVKDDNNFFDSSVVNENDFDVAGSFESGPGALVVQSGVTNRGRFRLSGVFDGGSSLPRAALTLTTGTFVNEQSGTFAIEAEGGGTFTGDLDNRGTMSVDEYLTMNKVNGNYLNSGTITIEANRPLIVNSLNSFENVNQITGGTGSLITFSGASSSSSTFINSGTITADGGIDFSGLLALANTGAGTITLGNDSSLSGGTFVNSGRVMLEDAPFTVTSAIFDNRAGGQLDDDGAFDARLVFDRSTLKVADAFSPGVRFWILDRSKVEGTGSITNDGALNIFSSSAATPSRISVPLTNSGIIQVFDDNNFFDSSVVNEQGGHINVVGDVEVGHAALVVQSGVTNRGFFRLSGEVGGTTLPRAALTLTTGTFVNEQSGTFAIEAEGGGTLTGDLDNRGTMSVDYGLTMNKTNGNYLNSGTITVSGGNFTASGASFVNAAGAMLDIKATAGPTHSISASLDNRGTIEVRTGTLQLSGAVTQQVGSQLTGGAWHVRNATLNFTTGANITTNQADVILEGASSSFPKIDSLVDNDGSFAIQGGRNFTATSLFSNSGNLTVGAGSTFNAPGDLVQQSGSTLNGPGLVVGNVINSGTTSPGNTPGVLTITGGYTQQSNGKLQIELAGNAKGTEYDSLSVTGVGTLGGILEVLLLDLGGGLFTPQPGNSFEILTSTTGVSGTFASKLLPSLGGGRLWNDVAYGTNNVVLSVGGVLGDYNLNGIVDAADYVLWRKSLGQTGAGLLADGNGNGQIDTNDYDVWRAHIGQTALGAGSGPAGATPSQTAVPEPAAIVLLMFAAACRCLRRSRAS